MVSCLTVHDTMVTGIVLLSMKFHNFLCAGYNATPPNTPKNEMVALSPFPYVTELSADAEASLLNMLMRCVTSSLNLHYKTYNLNVYTENP